MATGVIRQTNATGLRVVRVLRALRFGEAAQNAALTAAGWDNMAYG